MLKIFENILEKEFNSEEKLMILLLNDLYNSGAIDDLYYTKAFLRLLNIHCESFDPQSDHIISF